MKLYEILIDIWDLLVGTIPPDYIIKLFNWISAVLMLLILFSPFLVIILILRMFKRSRYD